MACLKLGSKSETFHLNGKTWLCSTGLPSDVIVEIGDTSFHLHKFPLISRSELLESLMRELLSDDENSVLELHDIPGGAKAFLLVAKFCYDVKMELTASNVVALRCAAEYLRMTEDYQEGNLIMQTENFLNHIFGFWTDSIKALKTCEEVLLHAEELHIVSRCLDSLVLKACADPSLFNWPVSGATSVQTSKGTEMWNGISIKSNSVILGEDWWYEDISFLSFPFYNRFILGVSARCMKPERIAGSLIYYAKKHLPLLGSQSSFQNGNGVAFKSSMSNSSEEAQRNLLEDIVELLPNEKGITPTKFLLGLLGTSMALHATSSCCAYLEKIIGAQLGDAALDDILIPSTGYSMETLYDVDCVHRIVDHFMTVENDVINPTSSYVEDEKQLTESSHAPSLMAKVANLVDGYLVEVAPDVNLKPSKFQALAALVPEHARPMDDGIYRAVDAYLKAHPWLTDSEKEQICRLMNCQKLSLEASTHAAQNERLPLRTIVQVLFFEQLKLRTSVSSWFYASDNLENSEDHSGDLSLVRDDAIVPHDLTFNDMKERVIELQKECLSMKQELEKMKTKVSWNMVLKKFGSMLISKPCNLKAPKPCSKSKISPAISAVPQMEDKAVTVMNRKIDI